jgi:hypothetical protein
MWSGHLSKMPNQKTKVKLNRGSPHRIYIGKSITGFAQSQRGRISVALLLVKYDFATIRAVVAGYMRYAVKGAGSRYKCITAAT